MIRAMSLLLVVACAGDATSQPMPSDTTPTGLGSTDSALPDDTASVAPPPTDAEVAAWVSVLEGGWSGRAVDTPLGDMPFGIAFAPSGGGMHGEVSSYGFGFRFSFEPTPDGWVFTERGTLPGGIVQEHDLVPVALEGAGLRWESLEPGVLTVLGTADGERLVLDVAVRGAPHCVLDLARAR